MELKPVRVRFAPSPTGHLHLGGARTALYDYLIAKKTGGKFILRIEDTDQKRYVPEAEEEFINSLKWMGLQWDEGPDVGGDFGPYRQSLRKEIYQVYAEKLIEMGKAYYCFCSSERLDRVRQEQQKRKEAPRYDGTCRNIQVEEARIRIANGEKYVIRFKMPKEGTTTVKDLIRGDISVENANLDDYILVKSDGLALYHLAAMIDDHLMEITHVIRGSEWLPSLPLHSQIHRAFGWEEPIWVHLSVFLKPSGKGKMSKRESADLIKDGHSIFMKDLEELGYLPEGVVNWISLMGWAYDDHTEFFKLDDLVEKFSLEHLNPSPAAINFQKFDHFNGLHIRSLIATDLAKRIKPFFEKAGLKADLATLTKIAPIIMERIVTLDDAVELAGFFFRDVTVNPEMLVPKELSKEETINILNKVESILKDKGIVHSSAEPALRDYVEGSGYSAGQVFGVMRIAITGQKVSPPLFETMEIIGTELVLNRIARAKELLTG